MRRQAIGSGGPPRGDRLSDPLTNVAVSMPASRFGQTRKPPRLRQRPCLPPCGVQQSGRAFPHWGTADPTLGPLSPCQCRQAVSVKPGNALGFGRQFCRTLSCHGARRDPAESEFPPRTGRILLSSASDQTRQTVKADAPGRKARSSRPKERLINGFGFAGIAA